MGNRMDIQYIKNQWPLQLNVHIWGGYLQNIDINRYLRTLMKLNLNFAKMNDVLF